MERLSVHFKRFRGAPIRALDDVSFEVREGDYFALLGENGAGKSTAMHCLLGLLRPTAGLVSIFGAPVVRGSSIFERIGYIPEEPHYPGYLRVGETLDYYASLYSASIPSTERTAILERLGLAEFRDLLVSKCSKGMKQKLGIAQALINRPTLLLLDEPMRGLDPVGVRDFREMLDQLHRGGTTIVMNSHILAEVEDVASTVAILKRGKLVATGSVEELTRVETDRFVVDYEGSEVVFPGAEAVAHEGSVRRISVPGREITPFLGKLESEGGRLLSCVRHRRTLEESFLDVVREEKP